MPFFKKKPKPKQQAQVIARTRKQINKFEAKSRELDRLAMEERERAKMLLKQKQETAARQALQRSKMYQKQAELVRQKIATLQRSIIAIQSVQDNVEFAKTAEIIDRTIESTLRDVGGQEGIEEKLMGLEESIDQATMLDEAVADVSMNVTELGMEDMEFDADFESLRQEIAEEQVATSLPSVPVAETKTEEQPIAEKKKQEEDEELDKELEELRKLANS